MSSVAFIATTRQHSVTAGKSTAQQAVATSRPPPAANASSATISQAARDLAVQENRITISPDAPHGASYKQDMAEKFAGLNQQRAMMASDPSNPLWAKTADELAHHDFNVDTDVLYDISGTVPGGDGILRYSSGEPVTAESQAYATQQGSNYQNALLQLYNSEMAQKTPPGDILIKMLDLQEQQPARFRAMSMWPIAADFPSSQPGAASGGVKS